MSSQSHSNSITLNPTVRTVVSLAVLIHFFAVFAALYGSLAPGRDGDRNLKERLRGVVTPYSQLLNYDSTARFFLTHATADDVDCRLEYLPKSIAATDNAPWVPVAQGVRGSDRFQRFQRLAEILAGLADRQNDEEAAIVATAIGEHLAQRLGEDVGQIRCRRHLLQEANEVEGTNLNRRDPDDPSYFVEVYRAQLIRIGSGRLQMRRLGSAGQEAPVIKRASPP